jgi:hypothetical protein
MCDGLSGDGPLTFVCLIVGVLTTHIDNSAVKFYRLKPPQGLFDLRWIEGN